MIFTLENMTFRYRGKSGFCLGPLSLSFDSRRITAVIGSNGSGKTTLIRVLLRQLTPGAGEYMVDAKPVDDRTGDFCHSNGIGYAPENPILDETLTGNEIVQIVKDLRGISDETFAAEIKSFGSYLQLGGWFQTVPCRECSQGMRRKITLITAWLGAQSCVIIDEPTNGLDPIAVFGVKKIMQARRENGVGTLISSHVLDLVEKIADDLIILREGRIAFAGSLGALSAQWPGKSLDEIYYLIFTNETTAGVE